MRAEPPKHSVKELGELSPIGENWAHWQGFCRYWDIKATSAYRGAWSVEEGLKKTAYVSRLHLHCCPDGTLPSRFPILFVRYNNPTIRVFALRKKLM